MSDNTPKRGEWPNLDHDPDAGAKTGGAGANPDAGTNPGEGASDREDLLRQFQELGQRLATTARAAWQSEQRQDLQQEIKDGLRSVREQLNEAVEGARSSARTQEMADTVKERVSRASETVRSGDLLGEVRGGLAMGLRELNEQLRRFTERLEGRDGDAPDTTASGTSETGTRAAPASVADMPTTATSAAPPVGRVVPVGTPDPDALPEAPAATKNDLPVEPEGPASGERA
jgi:hypothetical protein